MAVVKELKAVVATPGKPLYVAAKDSIRQAIDAGMYRPGEQMPSTKLLSEQMSVSLVTAHRALQELVSAGVLQRSQGKGTFVHERYFDRKSKLSDCRVGLVFEPGASLADFYHSQILEGVRQASRTLAVDLILLRFGEDVRNECDGYLLVNPLPDEMQQLAQSIASKLPALVVGAKSETDRIVSVDVDNVELARTAVRHLAELRHQRIGYVGGEALVSNNRDRWSGYSQECAARKIAVETGNVLKGTCWRLDERERGALIRMLSAPSRPTAIFTAGYYFALDVYGAATTVGLRIPEDLSVVGVDDPPSAAHLSPPLTTLRQPLVELGKAAVAALSERIVGEQSGMENQMLRAELIVRKSTAAAASNGRSRR